MKNRFLLGFAIVVMAIANSANAQVTIEAIDIRGTGVFGGGADDAAAGLYLNHAANASAITLNGGAFPGNPRTAADPIEIQMTYSNLDLDFDGTANDAITFTIRWEKVDFDGDGMLEGGDLASFGQGIDTGFGNLNDMQVSVTGVTGTTTDSGSPIFFDGFVGAGLGAGSGTDVDRTAEVNGTTLTFALASTGTFQFSTQTVDFTATPTVVIDNSGDTDFDGMGDGGLGSIVARNYDLQFSLNDPANGPPPTVEVFDFNSIDDGLGFNGSIDDISVSGNFSLTGAGFIQENETTAFLFENGGMSTSLTGTMQVLSNPDDTPTIITIQRIGANLDADTTITGFSAGGTVQEWQISGVTAGVETFAAPTSGSFDNPIDTIVWDQQNYVQGTFPTNLDFINFFAPTMAVLKGDVNLDGEVTFLDINPFILLLAANGFQAEADCDCDGDLDFLDIQPFINILAGAP